MLLKPPAYVILLWQPNLARIPTPMMAVHPAFPTLLEPPVSSWYRRSAVHLDNGNSRLSLFLHWSPAHSQHWRKPTLFQALLQAMGTQS